MTPSSLLSYYPTYEILDSVVSKNSNCNTLNLFVDLKNALQTVYMEHAIKIIVENSLRSDYIDTSVFSSILPFLTFHKLYALKRDININFYFFFEVGQSYYHKNLNKKYKISRLIDDLYGLEKHKREKFTEVMQSNFTLIDKALNLMPNIKVFRLENLEADFIPYFLITRGYIGNSVNECNVIYSNDHDLHQCCNQNTFIYSKSGGKHKKRQIISENDVMKKFLNEDTDIHSEYLPLAMSIIGDPGDDVYGIKGIGGKTFFKNFDDIAGLIDYDMNKLYDNVMAGNDIFNKKGIEYQNKYINKIVEVEEENNLISNNLKQVSFELISRNVESPFTTEMANRRDYILEVLNSQKFATLSSMKEALRMNRVYIENDELDVIYYEYRNDETDL